MSNEYKHETENENDAKSRRMTMPDADHIKAMIPASAPHYIELFGTPQQNVQGEFIEGNPQPMLNERIEYVVLYFRCVGLPVRLKYFLSLFPLPLEKRRECAMAGVAFGGLAMDGA